MPRAAWNTGRAWSRTYIVANTASRKNRIQSLLTPAEHFRVGAHQQRERLAVAELVVAPLLEPAEDRVDHAVRMGLQVAEDGDVAGVADLLGQVGRVEDELGPEVGVFLGLGQEAEIDADAHVLEAVVDEAGVAGLVAGHEGEQVMDVAGCDALLDLGIEHAAGELGGDGADQEFEQLFAQRRVHVGEVDVELLVADEVALVGVGAQFGDQAVPFAADAADVDLGHGVEIGGVEARRQDRVLLGERRRVVDRWRSIVRPPWARSRLRRVPSIRNMDVNAVQARSTGPARVTVAAHCVTSRSPKPMSVGTPWTMTTSPGRMSMPSGTA